MEDSKKPEWAVCPHCNADLEQYGLNYDCVHHVDIAVQADGDPYVAVDRDIHNGGIYWCGCCGEEIGRSSIEEVDSAYWHNA